jgi:hypothetical protein
MASIKFSHVYNKLKDVDGKPIKTAKLLLVLPVANDAIREMKDFIEYDTDKGKYTIQYATWYLLLLFLKPNGDLFTTVRPQWNNFGNKKPYYDKLIGHDLDVVITSIKEVYHG